MIYFEMCFLTKPGTHQFIYTGWPMSSRSLPIPAPSIAMGLCTTPCLNFMFIVVIRIQVPMLARQVLLSAEPSLQPPCTVFVCLYFTNLCLKRFCLGFGLLLFFQSPKAHHQDFFFFFELSNFLGICRYKLSSYVGIPLYPIGINMLGLNFCLIL